MDTMELTLGEFAEDALWGDVHLLVCNGCVGEDGCRSCPGRDIVDEIEYQVQWEGIAFMENLVREWAK